jgi:membrane protease YdiL (CAAX protease family)
VNGEAVKNDEQASLPWGPVAAVVVSVAIFFIAQIAGGVIVSLYPLVMGWDTARATDWLSSSVIAQFSAVLLIEVISLGMLFWFLNHIKAHPKDIGLKRPRFKDFGYALLGFGMYLPSYIIVVQVIKALIPTLNLEQKQEIGFSTDVVGSSLVFIFISLVLLPPIVEEVISRGFLYTGLRSKLGKVTAAIITSVIFAVAHLQLGSGNALLWIAAIDTFVLSMILVYLREKTDSLAASIGLHMIKNGIAFTSLFILKIV